MRGRAFRYWPGQDNSHHCVVVPYVGARGSESEQCCLLGSQAATHKQIGPFWCLFLGGWVSPKNFLVSLGVFPAAVTPCRFLLPGVLRLYSSPTPTPPVWSPWLHSLSCSPIVFPGYPQANAGPCGPPATALPWSSQPQPPLPVFAPPTCLNACFFSKSWLLDFYTV